MPATAILSAPELPASYLESRRRFRELGGLAGAVQASFEQGANAQAEPLTTDVAWLGRPDAQNLIVVASGTHGVEGYAGAMCQLRFLQQYRARYAQAGIAFLLVHAVNPWGYLHDRRVTAEGVDLNRNFIDFPRAETAPSAYGAYHRLLVQDFKPLPSGLFNELRLLGHALLPQRRQVARAAITGGQYDHADGLFYGGAAPAASRLVWERIVRSYVQGRRRTLLLDIHTGLGRRGEMEIISYLPSDSARFAEQSGWFGGKLRSMASGDSVSAKVAGDLTAGFDAMVGEGSSALGLEFGTASPLQVLYALRADQWARNLGAKPGSPEREAARRRMKAAFAPSDPAWAAKVASQFDGAMQTAASLFSR